MLQTDVDVDGLRFPSNTHISSCWRFTQPTKIRQKHGEGGSMPINGSLGLNCWTPWASGQRRRNRPHPAWSRERLDDLVTILMLVIVRYYQITWAHYKTIAKKMIVFEKNEYSSFIMTIVHHVFVLEIVLFFTFFVSRILEIRSGALSKCQADYPAPCIWSFPYEDSMIIAPRQCPLV